MVDLRRFLLRIVYALKLAGSRIPIWRKRVVNISDELNLKEEIKAGFADLSASFTIVSSAFSEISASAKGLPDFERGQLEPLSRRLADLHLEISKLMERFKEIDKSSLSKEDQKTLWGLDDLANRFRVNLLAEEVRYKIRTKPTMSKSPNVDPRLLDEIDTLLRNMIEILESSKNIIRSKVSWFQMQQMIRSSRTLEILTIVLIFLTIILALDIILRRAFRL